MAQQGDTSTERQITVISLLRRTNHLMVNEITERMEASGFPDSPPSFHPIFENLDPEGTRLTVLAARAGLTHQSVGEVVTELERRGYVERIPDPTDKRARLVSLTDRGRDLVRAAVKHIGDIEREWGDRWRAGGLQGDVRAALIAGLVDAEHESDGPSDSR
jgi:DNA-binding MarR family transcriptional regulator